MKNFNYEFHPFYPQDLKREGAQKLARAVLETLDEDIAQCQKEMQKSWRKVVDSFFSPKLSARSQFIQAYLDFYYAERKQDFLSAKNTENKMLEFWGDLAK